MKVRMFNQDGNLVVARDSGEEIFHYKCDFGHLALFQGNSEEIVAVKAAIKEYPHRSIWGDATREAAVKLLDQIDSPGQFRWSQEGDLIKSPLVPYKVGEVVKGQITGRSSFCLWVTLESGHTSMLHVQHLKNLEGKTPPDENGNLKVRIISIDPFGRVDVELT